MNNRLIKFRAQRIDNKQWVYGNYFTTPLTDENSGADSKDGCFFLCGPKRHCIEQNGVSFVIDINTLGQFTGLKDENGKEIYEGDIMASRGNYMTDEMDENGNFIDIYNVVVWNQKMTRFALKPIDEYLDELKNPINPKLDHPWICSIDSFKEVIGNICENPDMLLKLLKKQKKDEEKAKKHLEDITSECEACGENAVIEGMCGHCGHEER